MASHRIGRRARRSLLVASIAIIGVGVLALAATSEEPSKPGPVLPPEGALQASPATEIGATETVTGRAQLPSGVTCPDGWSYFDNPVMRYGLCVPPGWGFSDFRGSEPLDHIPTAMLENLHLLGNAFPWRPGTMPFDAVRQGATDIELNVLPGGATSGDECQPSTKRQLGRLTVLTCEQPYGSDELPAPRGQLHALKMIVPLQAGPADEPGARLLVIARTRTAASPAEVTALWQIVQNIHAY